MDRADVPLGDHMRKLLIRGLLAAGALSGLFGCKGAVNNMDIGQMVQGGGAALRAATMSEKDEDSLGQSIAIKATNTYGLYGDDNLTRYVELVGEVVATASPRPDLMYRYGILKSDTEINAFSGPT